MYERRFVGDFGYRIDVFEVRPPETLREKLLRRPHLERVDVMGGMLSKVNAQEIARVHNEEGYGRVYKVAREIPPDFIV